MKSTAEKGPDIGGLTRAQHKLLRAIADGWAVTSLSAIHDYGRARMTKGGASCVVHKRTLEGLHDRKLIEPVGPGPAVAWVRTKNGEQATR